MPRRGGPVALVARRLRPADRGGGRPRSRARVPGLGEGGHHGRRRGPRAPHPLPGVRRPAHGRPRLGAARPRRGRARAGPRHRGPGHRRGGAGGPRRPCGARDAARAARACASTRATWSPRRWGRRDEIEGVRLAALDGGPPAAPGPRHRDRLRHGVPGHRARAAGRAAPDPGLPARLPLRVAGASSPRPTPSTGPACPRSSPSATAPGVDEGVVTAPDRASGRGGAPGSPPPRRSGHRADAGPGAPEAPEPAVVRARAHDYWRQWLRATLGGGRAGHPRLPVRGGHARGAGRRPAPALSRAGRGPDARPEPRDARPGRARSTRTR